MGYGEGLQALGDYTETVHDFTVFPAVEKEGRSGPYWYHEDTQSYFDDVEQYKMIKAMCRLSCSVCDKVEENAGNASKRRASLCLEGRKVFICEQKLYNKAQLKQHRNTGDSEVDGSESERGGFQGHPFCEFCRTPFYGDNELYTHMSADYFTYKILASSSITRIMNTWRQVVFSDDNVYTVLIFFLQIHFRQRHYLCEDEACLSKKFVVFNSEV
nr:hypothetical protein [Tanacetum cinerariifolium]